MGEALWIMIAGPYGNNGTCTQAEKDANLLELSKAALAVFELGHIPVVGVHQALPLMEVAVNGRSENTSREEAMEAASRGMMMPISLALAQRCDACLRIGGKSAGADEEAAHFRQANKPVYRALNQLPKLTDPA